MTIRADLRPEHESEWAVVRRALADGALRSGSPAILASTLPDLIVGEARTELAEQGIPVVGGIRRQSLQPLQGQKRSSRIPVEAASRLRAIAAAARSHAEPHPPKAMAAIGRVAE